MAHDALQAAVASPMPAVDDTAASGRFVRLRHLRRSLGTNRFELRLLFIGQRRVEILERSVHGFLSLQKAIDTAGGGVKPRRRRQGVVWFAGGFQ